MSSDPHDAVGVEGERSDVTAQPLAGLRVLDISSVVMGPYATQILGDLGAEVVVIEQRAGDANRYMSPGPHPECSGIALNLMRNKRSVCLDLKHPDGLQACLRLASNSDVLVTNLRPKALRGLGLSFEAVKAVSPRIVYCEAHGYEPDGPNADAPAYDDTIQSASGLADAVRRVTGEPAPMPTIVADKVTGLTVVNSVLAGVIARARTGEAQHIELSMEAATRAFVLVEHGAGAIPRPPLDVAGYRRILTAERCPKRTTDGWITILPYSKDNWVDLFRWSGRTHLEDDPRIETLAARIHHSDELYRELGRLAAEHSTRELVDFCTKAQIPVSLVRTLDEVVAEFAGRRAPAARRQLQGDPVSCDL